MNRRLILTAIATVSGGLVAGCIDTGSSDGDAADNNQSDSSASDTNQSNDNSSTESPTEYEECRQSVIFADELPNDISQEVEIAVDEGVYETDGHLYLREVMSSYTSYIRVDGRYLEPTIETDAETTTLTFEESIPSHDEGPISLRNESNESVVISLTVEYQPYSDELENETIVDDEFELRSNTSEKLPSEFHRYGRYQAEYTFESEGEIRTMSWTVDLGLTPSGLSIENDKQLNLEGEAADIDPCSW